MIGEKIRIYRRKKGISLTELSRQANISKSYLSYIERDVKQNPSIDVLMKIASVLGISIEDLIENSEESNEDEELLDDEWLELIREAIKAGVTKEQFKEFQEYVKYENWSKNKSQRRNDEGKLRNDKHSRGKKRQ
ncbi:helix-turn-helix domain-containing protein [Alteribacillus sp. HJP-4]|uniref:helix-turn-helix domain-containing protein n=1 Tax=Alteribacillus sp. HJP-4 TaxID=2775394 RepID=UPI0035CCF4FF